MKRGSIFLTSLVVVIGLFIGLRFFLLPLAPFLNEAVNTAISIVIPFIILVFLIYFWWAPNNLFFTFVDEGTAKIVVRASGFKKALIQWNKHDFTRTSGNDHWNVIKQEPKSKHFGGLRFYGIWPFSDIYIYRFSWASVQQDGEVSQHKKEVLDYILLKEDVYWFKIEKAEDKNLLPLNLEIVIPTRVVNPYKALFEIQDWLEAILNRLAPAARDIITNDTYEEWTQSEKDVGAEIYKRFQSNGILDEFENQYGVYIRAIEVKEIDPGEQFRRESMQQYLAEQESKRITVLAEAEKKRIETVYKQVQEHGEVGQLVRTLEALEKSPEKGSKLILPIPGMTDVLSKIFPGGKKEELSSEDVAVVKSVIEQFRQGEKKED